MPIKVTNPKYSTTFTVLKWRPNKTQDTVE